MTTEATRIGTFVLGLLLLAGSSAARGQQAEQASRHKPGNAPRPTEREEALDSRQANFSPDALM